jgi:hypothetical protein
VTKHALKVWPEFFHPLMTGEKTFEIRKNDRYFKVDDTLHLQEWNPTRNIYTGRELWKRVSYITDFPAGIREGYVVMGLSSV